MNPEKKRRRAKLKAKDARMYKGGKYPELRRLNRGQYELTEKGRRALES